jgi:hypothetical protein
MNSIYHFLHIYHLDFPFKEVFLPSTSEKILWSNKFLKVPPKRNDLKKNQDDLCFLQTFEFQQHDLSILILWHIAGLST